MKTLLRKLILAGGILNSLLALFHVYLCYQINHFYGQMPVYPLLQMFAVGGMIMIFFLAYTSLFNAADMISTRIGQAAIMLNILIYLTRTLGEFILFPRQNPVIVGVCLVLTILYAYSFIEARKNLAAVPREKESVLA